MSNARAAAGVTAALVTLVQQAVDTLGITPGPVVTASSLEDSGDHGRISIALYRITRNGYLGNDTLPSRHGTGRIHTTPRAAFDLHYLLCFRADSDFDAHTMLAAAAVAVEAQPTVSANLLALAAADHPEIVGNDLADAAEYVRLSTETLGSDEVARLWALYPPGSFAPTLAVTAGPVVIDSTLVAPPTYPVRTVGNSIRPSTAGPRLDTIAGPDGIGAPIRATSAPAPLTLRGAGFCAGGQMDALIDGVVAPTTVVDDGEITVATPILDAGGHRIQVRRSDPPGDSQVSSTRQLQFSETRVAWIVPSIDGTPTVAAAAPPAIGSGVISATVHPPVRRGQRVSLILDTDARTLVLPCAPLADAPGTGVDFPFLDLPSATYRITLDVNGVRSIPPVDASDRYAPIAVTL